MDDDFPFLPPEIIRNFLKRLPVKSLIRFQCVCRQWRILFKTQSFIVDHLVHSNHENPCLLMKDVDWHDPSNMYCLDSEMQVWEFQNPPLLSYLRQGKILGSSNGLLCVEILKVYSLSSGSWKEEKIRFNNGTRCVTSRGVTVNGVMFWWGYKTVGEHNDFKRLIVSFDLAMEVFTVIPTPQLKKAYGFTVYEEKLAIFSWIGDLAHSVIDLWVMEEGVGASGEIWSWTKKYSIGPYPCFLCPRTIWRNEIVGHSQEGGESTVFFLNLTTKKTCKFAIGKFGYKEWIFNYAESLVPVGGMKSSTIFL
ncbi:hypothetical protein K1719_001592 [Acacia pycnantha]|nr:hypothetical protein K1719_001592 [Acacia pycnantha]